MIWVRGGSAGVNLVIVTVAARGAGSLLPESLPQAGAVLMTVFAAQDEAWAEDDLAEFGAVHIETGDQNISARFDPHAQEVPQRSVPACRL